MRRQVPRPVVAVYALFGVFCVHALRYALAPGQAVHGSHAYLELVPPVLVGLLAVAIVQLAVAGAIERRVAEGRRLGWRSRWLRGTLAFLALYVAQENAEVVASAGHLVGPAALLAGGGWVVVPLTVAAGGALAALLRGTEAALARLTVVMVARHAAPFAPWRSGGHGRADVARAVRAPELARHLAGRAPPAAC